MRDSIELLRQYAEERTEAAFAELVRRHIDFVYGVALRQLSGDTHLAQDVAQRVFTDLARKARPLSQRPTLSGWLYRSTQFAAATAVRTERRRRSREQEAHTMNEFPSSGPPRDDWTQVRPELDRVMSRLSDGDRDAVMLRFFDGQPFAEIGRRLRLSENAAAMRVERALEKLRVLLARRGIASTPAALSAMLSGPPDRAAPAGAAAVVSGIALSAAAGGSGLTLLHLMSSIKLQGAVAGLLLATGLTAVVRQQHASTRLRQEITALNQQMGAEGPGQGLRQIARLRNENQGLAQAATEAADLREADAGLAGVRRALAARIAQSRGPAGAAKPPLSRSRANGPIIYDPAMLDQQPVPIFQVRPAYPPAMAKAGSSGQVLVDFDLEANGTVSGVAATSSSDPAFAKAAETAVQQWKFNPGQIDGQPAGVHLQVPIVFGVSGDSGGTVDGFKMFRSQAMPTTWF